MGRNKRRHGSLPKMDMKVCRSRNLKNFAFTHVSQNGNYETKSRLSNLSNKVVHYFSLTWQKRDCVLWFDTEGA